MFKSLVKIGLMFYILLLFTPVAMAAVEEYPLFNKLEGFTLQKQSKYENFGSYTFQTGKSSKEKSVVEGRYFNLRYSLDKGVENPGKLYVIRNFTNAVKQAGGEILYEKSDNAVMRLIQGDKEVWVRVNCAANGSWYYLNIIEKGTMKQEVVVNKLLDAIKSTGKATVYINFDIASSKIQADSMSIIDEIFDMLQQSPDLKLSIEGHTDSDGTSDGNQKLSEERALAVKDALISKGCNANRLISRGYGMSSPVADNNSEEGKAKNRRVELLKTN